MTMSECPSSSRTTSPCERLLSTEEEAHACCVANRETAQAPFHDESCVGRNLEETMRSTCPRYHAGYCSGYCSRSFRRVFGGRVMAGSVRKGIVAAKKRGDVETSWAGPRKFAAIWSCSDLTWAKVNKLLSKFQPCSRMLGCFRPTWRGFGQSCAEFGQQFKRRTSGSAQGWCIGDARGACLT